MMKNIGIIALSKLLSLVQSSINDRVHKDDEIIEDDVVKIFEQAGGWLPPIQNNSDTPVGTIISYMGISAPDGFLICDGTAYQIEDYPDLAKHIKDHFGTINYFGGNGSTTFAVPDLRNHFLRGYHGTSGQLLSGNIGKKQDPTNFPMLFVWGSNNLVEYGGANKDNKPANCDSYSTTKNYGRWIRTNIAQDETAAASYTARPLNTAVLFCIRAIPPIDVHQKDEFNTYSTDEIRIGTWIDGKPLYRKCVNTKSVTSAETNQQIYALPNNCIIHNVQGYLYDTSNTMWNINSAYGASGSVFTAVSNSKYVVFQRITANLDVLFNRDCFLILEYTKSTD